MKNNKPYAEFKSLTSPNLKQIFCPMTREEVLVYGFLLGKLNKHVWVESIMKYINYTYTEFDIDKVGNCVVYDILNCKRPTREMRTLNDIFEIVKSVNVSIIDADTINVSKRTRLVKLEKCLKLCVSNLTLLDPIP